jgi:hypothetical protein
MAALLAAVLPARADDQADAKALLEKAIKAHGGADNLAKGNAATLTMKGKFYGMGDGIEYTASAAFQPPDKQRIEVDFTMNGQKFKFTQVFTKDKGWVAINDMVTEMGKESLYEAKEYQHATGVSRLNPAVLKDAKLQSLGEIKIGDKPAVGLRVEVKGYRDVVLYFDKETHLLVKSERRAKDIPNPAEEFGEDVYYSDYKEVDGVKMPQKVTIKRDDKPYVESETTDYKTVDKIDDAQFGKP